jgi:hypothetical protein
MIETLETENRDFAKIENNEKTAQEIERLTDEDRRLESEVKEPLIPPTYCCCLWHETAQHIVKGRRKFFGPRSLETGDFAGFSWIHFFATASGITFSADFGGNTLNHFSVSVLVAGPL